MNFTMNEKQNFKIYLELGRASVIYADEEFTVYITLKNISDKTLYIWEFGILDNTDLSFFRGVGKKNERSLITQVGRSFKRVTQDKNYTKEEIDECLTYDFMKGFYSKLFKDKGYLPLELSAGETFSGSFTGKTKRYLFFRPDKYKLTLFVDYSNNKKIFFQETKVVEVDVLASFKAITNGAVIGGFLGTVVRICLTPYYILNMGTVFEILGAMILSLLAVIALARKSGAQTLITIQDFWGGIFIGFLVGYSGKTFFDNLIGV